MTDEHQAGPGPGSWTEQEPRKLATSQHIQAWARRIAQLIALVLQRLILGLEQLIELLGCEPDRRWENALVLHACGAGKGDVKSICKRAKMLAEKGYTEDALSLYVKVLEIEPDNTVVMDMAAELLAELGDAEGAKELLARSIELQPSMGYEKFVLLGHLENGMTAVCAFERGLELLKNEAAQLKGALDGSSTGKETAARLPQIQKKMSIVLVAMAKVYLTDFFEEENAKQTCEALLDRALEYDSENPEACQALGDLRLSQGRRGEALMLVRRATEICSSLPDGLVPTYDFRMVSARLLVELSQYEGAAEALEELCAEDEEDTEAWYLLGICLMLMCRTSACKTALEKAKQLLIDGCGNGSNDGALMDQIEALLQRRAISEEEKEQFWNPRWWVTSTGKAAEHIRRDNIGSDSEGDGQINSEAVVTLQGEADGKQLSTPRNLPV